jgi:hypothetical protein
MTDAEPGKLGLTARLVLIVAAALLVADIAWHGVTAETIQRAWYQLTERPNRPMAFRFVLQPLMAVIVAAVHGYKDAGAGRAPYFWTVMTNPRERVARLREGLNATARVVLLGMAMDVIYQFVVLEEFYPVEALIVAVLVGFVPYLVLRGIATRIIHAWRSPSPAHRG